MALFVCALPAAAQDALSLKEAVHKALENNKSIEAASAAQRAAQTRIAGARSGYLPKVNYAESWARSDNPVFVFSSLLTQHQFGAQNFEITTLNHPDFLNNFQSRVTADETLYDAGRTKTGVRSAELAKEAAGETHRLTQMEVIAGVVRTYYGAILAARQQEAADQALRSAQADLERAQAIRAAGMSTDADVLSIRVHRAAVEELRIRRAADLEVARAALNEVLGLPLDTPHTLSTPMAPSAAASLSLPEYEATAVAGRPEVRQARLALNLAETELKAARSALLPQVSLHTAFEADRQRFLTRAGANWLVSVGMRWNLFNGSADRARIEESTFAIRRNEAEQDRTASAIRLQVRRAHADLEAAQRRIGVVQASVAEAEESLRITQNRYQAGLSNITELLRTETAVLEVRTRYLAAIHDQRIAAALLELAAGRLSENSEVLN